ncbi:MAG: hypothetical protein JXR37_00045 [Kiritimatiellae bacterium]|nr:hypothetical protein [Kiritimatiellia bacterium]
MGELAQGHGAKLEVCLYGGAVMMLAYNAREITRDVDAVIEPSELGWRLARQVGEELGLPEAWINDRVKQFLAPRKRTRRLPWEAPGIALTVPTAGYLLAMKALACRQPLPGFQGDFDDLRFLVRKTGVKSVGAIQEHIDRYYPDDVLPDEDAAMLKTILDEVWG